MPVFEVTTRRLSKKEAEEHRRQQADSRWWAQQPAGPYAGKFVAVVNCEAFAGETWEEAEQKALDKYPGRKPVVTYVPPPKGVLLL